MQVWSLQVIFGNVGEWKYEASRLQLLYGMESVQLNSTSDHLQSKRELFNKFLLRGTKEYWILVWLIINAKGKPEEHGHLFCKGNLQGALAVCYRKMSFSVEAAETCGDI